ncbi:MAG TPA: hypothetical protein VN832_08700 [Stellaceae bacterium]|nr:hypothetical protein [Stellaceae bacterium]
MAPNYRLYDLDPGFRLIELPSEPLAAATEQRVAAIWANEMQARGTGLYDGRIYTLIAYRRNRLTVRPMQYRHLIARRRVPELALAGLALRPLGVTGLLTCPDGIVLGRRAAHVAADAGLWEPAPAGSLDRLDPAALLLDELGEELGLTPAQVTPPVPCGLVEDLASGVVDILFTLKTDLDAAALNAAHRERGSGEYTDIAVVAPAALPDFLAAHEGALLPVLRGMLRHGRFLRDSPG